MGARNREASFDNRDGTGKPRAPRAQGAADRFERDLAGGRRAWRHQKATRSPVESTSRIARGNGATRARIGAALQRLAQDHVGVAVWPAVERGDTLETGLLVHGRRLEVVALHPDAAYATASRLTDERGEQGAGMATPAMRLVDPHLLELRGTRP